MDLFGFECFPKNRIEQLFVNCLNEQMQYHYNQRVFVWEMLEQEEEHLPVTKLNFYDNKIAVDHLMNTPKGLFHIIDDATRGQYTADFITDTVGSRKSPYLQRFSATEFSVAHYSGKINYDTRDFIEKNRDFLPPEMMETMRLSECDIIKTLFTNALSKSGNLTMAMTEIEARSTSTGNKGAKWANALVSEKIKNRVSGNDESKIIQQKLKLIKLSIENEHPLPWTILSNPSHENYFGCLQSSILGNPQKSLGHLEQWWHSLCSLCALRPRLS
jgi:myosin-3